MARQNALLTLVVFSFALIVCQQLTAVSGNNGGGQWSNYELAEQHRRQQLDELDGDEWKDNGLLQQQQQPPIMLLFPYPRLDKRDDRKPLRPMRFGKRSADMVPIWASGNDEKARNF